MSMAKFEAYGKKTPRAIDRPRLLAQEEERLANRADTVILISDNGRACSRTRRREHPRNPERDRCGDLRPEQTETPGAGENRTQSRFHRAVPPNIDAALRMIDDILPRIRERTRCSTASAAAGRFTEEPRWRPGVRIWGEVLT